MIISQVNVILLTLIASAACKNRTREDYNSTEPEIRLKKRHIFHSPLLKKVFNTDNSPSSLITRFFGYQPTNENNDNEVIELKNKVWFPKSSDLNYNNGIYENSYKAENNGGADSNVVIYEPDYKEDIVYKESEEDDSLEEIPIFYYEHLFKEPQGLDVIGSRELFDDSNNYTPEKENEKEQHNIAEEEKYEYPINVVDHLVDVPFQSDEEVLNAMKQLIFENDLLASNSEKMGNINDIFISVNKVQDRNSGEGSSNNSENKDQHFFNTVPRFDIKTSVPTNMAKAVFTGHNDEEGKIVNNEIFLILPKHENSNYFRPVPAKFNLSQETHSVKATEEFNTGSFKNLSHFDNPNNSNVIPPHQFSKNPLPTKDDMQTTKSSIDIASFKGGSYINQVPIIDIRSNFVEKLNQQKDSNTFLANFPNNFNTSMPQSITTNSLPSEADEEAYSANCHTLSEVEDLDHPGKTAHQSETTKNKTNSSTIQDRIQVGFKVLPHFGTESNFNNGAPNLHGNTRPSAFENNQNNILVGFRTSPHSKILNASNMVVPTSAADTTSTDISEEAIKSATVNNGVANDSSYVGFKAVPSFDITRNFNKVVHELVTQGATSLQDRTEHSTPGASLADANSIINTQSTIASITNEDFNHTTFKVLPQVHFATDFNSIKPQTDSRNMLLSKGDIGVTTTETTNNANSGNTGFTVLPHFHIRSNFHKMAPQSADSDTSSVQESTVDTKSEESHVSGFKLLPHFEIAHNFNERHLEIENVTNKINHQTDTVEVNSVSSEDEEPSTTIVSENIQDSFYMDFKKLPHYNIKNAFNINKKFSSSKLNSIEDVTENKNNFGVVDGERILPHFKGIFPFKSLIPAMSKIPERKLIPVKVALDTNKNNIPVFVENPKFNDLPHFSRNSSFNMAILMPQKIVHQNLTAEDTDVSSFEELKINKAYTKPILMNQNIHQATPTFPNLTKLHEVSSQIFSRIQDGTKRKVVLRIRKKKPESHTHSLDALDSFSSAVTKKASQAFSTSQSVATKTSFVLLDFNRTSISGNESIDTDLIEASNITNSGGSISPQNSKGKILKELYKSINEVPLDKHKVFDFKPKVIKDSYGYNVTLDK